SQRFDDLSFYDGGGILLGKGLYGVFTYRTLTALRMFVNDEINQLEYGVRIASHYLKPGG
ncbi:S-adenosyl-L-methionine-dependent methyltransferase METT5D1, partial [Caligus rogercresseyi]